MPAEKLRVACAQMNMRLGDADYNFAHAEELVRASDLVRVTTTAGKDFEQALAEAAGISYEFYEVELDGAHENTAVITFNCDDGSTVEVIGCSVGGGRIKITEIDGLAATAASDDAEELHQLASAVHARSEHVAEHRGVPQGEVADIRARLGVAAGEAAMRAHLLAALQGVAAAARRAMALGRMDDELDQALANGLAALLRAEDDECVHGELKRMNAAAARAFALMA